MGYTTYFEGSFTIAPTLTLEDKNWLDKFAEERHDTGNFPGYYCQWVPSLDGGFLVWDEGEKFYEYETWLQWLLDNFFIPREYVLNGEIQWSGEDSQDMGKLVINANKLTILEPVITWQERAR